MSNAARIAAKVETTTYTLIWGFLMNQSHQHSEKFTGPEGCKACWARVQAVMNKRGCPRNYGPSHPVCLLQVYSTEADGTRRRANFMAQMAGSPTIKWTDEHGQGWTCDSAGILGASCG